MKEKLQRVKCQDSGVSWIDYHNLPHLIILLKWPTQVGGQMLLKKVKVSLLLKNITLSKVNGDGKLPIQLLFECEKEDVDRDSLEYVDTVWRLLLAHPETVASLC